MEYRERAVLLDEVLKTPAAREVLRVWVNGEAQGFVFQADVWVDPAAWDLLLVDLSRHIARAFSDKHRSAPSAVLARIKEGFDAEWATPTVSTKDLS